MTMIDHGQTTVDHGLTKILSQGWYVMIDDDYVHQDFLMGLVDVVSNCFGESLFVLDYVINKENNGKNR